jgi:polar amino acid transport system permease protein
LPKVSPPRYETEGEPAPNPIVSGSAWVYVWFFRGTPVLVQLLFWYNAAYMSEIVRAGILSVDEGQTGAAQSLGMNRLQNLRHVVLPQAMRVIIPPTGNETISMLKTSSLAAEVTLGELLFKAQSIYSQSFQPIPLLMVASFWYLIVTTFMTTGQFYIERHCARGSARQLPPTPFERFKRGLQIRPAIGPFGSNPLR